MRRAILLLFVISVPMFAEDEIFDTVAGHHCFRELLRKSGWGLATQSEQAAFVVQQSDGSLQCQEWPSTNIYHGDAFHGVIPNNTIAIAHTHPVRYPVPSQHDNDEATRLGIPIYTITLRSVYKSLPGDGKRYPLTERQSWIRETPSTSIAAGKGGVSASR